jgi:hypothetical protein
MNPPWTLAYPQKSAYPPKVLLVNSQGTCQGLILGLLSSGLAKRQVEETTRHQDSFVSVSSTYFGNCHFCWQYFSQRLNYVTRSKGRYLEKTFYHLLRLQRFFFVVLIIFSWVIHWSNVHSIGLILKGFVNPSPGSCLFQPTESPIFSCRGAVGWGE